MYDRNQIVINSLAILIDKCKKTKLINECLYVYFFNSKSKDFNILRKQLLYYHFNYH